MLSINTNLSSLIAQNSLNASTFSLNQAIERMSTGCKINHAGDNAANYSISTNMSTKTSSFEVAQDNVAAGMDLVSVASDNLSLISDHASRIRDLCMQAQNGTYGQQSLNAIKSEANARIAEIVRLYNTAEYNGINLLNKVEENLPTDMPKAGASGFIDEDFERITPDVVVTDPTQLADAIAHNSTIGIANAETLAKLAELVNSGTTCSGKTITLTEDIDLSAYSTGEGWTPIGVGDSSHSFHGTFDGQGHKITNLYINRPDSEYQGLLGRKYGGGAIKNIGIENCNVTGKNYVGGLAGFLQSCYTDNIYVTGNVTGAYDVGGLVGLINYNTISNSYTSVNVTGSVRLIGGLVGDFYDMTSIDNCYTTGNVTGTGDYVGGLVGRLRGNENRTFYSLITNSYSTGDITGVNNTGGLVGALFSSHDDHEVKITDCCASGNISGKQSVGGCVGQINSPQGTIDIDNVENYSKKVSGTSAVGSLIGSIINTSDGTNFSTVTIENCKDVGVDWLNKIGGTYMGSVATPLSQPERIAEWENNISPINFKTALQVGINADSSCQIIFNTDFSFGLINSLKNLDVTDSSSLDFIDNFLNKVSEKQTELGAVQNRLDSAAESISVSIENLTKSRSTLRDADIAKESSEYIKAQILQQASSTLLATANQSPAIALQLI